MKLRVLVALVASMYAGVSLANGPEFQVSGIDLHVSEGIPLLDSRVVAGIFDQFKGKPITLDDLQFIRVAIEQVYEKDGFPQARVTLPDQDIGMADSVLFEVSQPKLNPATLMRVADTEVNFSDENVVDALPMISKGRHLNTNALGKQLALVNENLFKQTGVRLVYEDDGSITPEVSVIERKPELWTVSLDNSGGLHPSPYRAALSYRRGNLFDKDHMLTLSAQTSPAAMDKVAIFSAAYHEPLYAYGVSVDTFISHSDVDAGATPTPFGDLKLAGKGVVGGIRLNVPLNPYGSLTQRLVAGVDYKSFTNLCSFGVFGEAGCGAAAANVLTHPLSIAWQGTLTEPNQQTQLAVTLVQNIAGGTNGSTEALQRARAGATANFTSLQGSLQYTRDLPEGWVFRSVLTGQLSGNALVSAEQFGAGGAYSVRGFNTQTVRGDSGVQGSLEVQTPVLPTVDNLVLKGVAFTDWALVKNNHVLPGEPTSSTIGSVGVGLRANWKNVSAVADVSDILNGASDYQAGDVRVNFSVSASF